MSGQFGPRRASCASHHAQTVAKFPEASSGLLVLDAVGVVSVEGLSQFVMEFL
jgi:hypothetical protein